MSQGLKVHIIMNHLNADCLLMNC